MADWKKKDLLNIADLSEADVECLLEKSYFYKNLLEGSRDCDDRISLVLKDKVVANLFFESSTRTKMSFELAEKYLGARVLHFSFSESSCQKKEDFLETINTICQLNVDIIVARHSVSGIFQYLQKQKDVMPYQNVAIINAGDGMHCHPTQALTDAMTIRIKKGSLKRLSIAIVGDIAHSRVARSYIELLNKMGAQIFLLAPYNMLPAQIEKMGVKCFSDMKKHLPEMDVVVMLRCQEERQTKMLSMRDYTQNYGLRGSMLSSLKKDALVMHPGPVCVPVEMDRDSLYSDRSLIFQQVRNGLYMRMAVLDLVCFAREKRSL